MKKFLSQLLIMCLLVIPLAGGDFDGKEWNINDDGTATHKVTGETISTAEYLERSPWKLINGELVNKITGEKQSLTTKLKGTVLMGGDFSLNYDGGKNFNGENKTDLPASVGFEMGYHFNFMLKDKMSLGLGLNYSLEKENDRNEPQPTIQIDNKFTISPGITFYQPLGALDRGGFKEDIRINIGTGAQKQEYSGTEYIDRLFSVGTGINIGAFYDPTPCTRLSATAGLIDFDWQKTFNKENKDIGYSEFSFDSMFKKMYLNICVEAALGSKRDHRSLIFENRYRF